MDVTLDHFMLFTVPLLGFLTLGLAKLASGDWIPAAHAQFYVTLLSIMILTARTVYLCDPSWLIHTMTLGCMVVGAMAVPGQRVTTPQWA